VEAIADALGVTVSQILSDKSPKLVRVKQIEIDFEKAIDFVAEALKKNQDRFDDLASRIDDLEKRI
jgi:transcriptional regulator with XRE-family HTH domain